MKMTFHLSASQWANWKQEYGDHPDVLWRDLKQKFAKYALVKFDLQKDDIQRTATADIEARAFTHVRGDGTRGIEIPKEFRLISNTGREWVFDFTSQQSPYAPILGQASRVILPAEATNARLDEPGTGFQQLVYQMPDHSSANVLLLAGGLFAMGSGIILGILGLLFFSAFQLSFSFAGWSLDRSMNGAKRSIGTGKNVVVLCSLEISFMVCRNRRWRAIGCSEIIAAACTSFSAA
jgi:hypothetical protein